MIVAYTRAAAIVPSDAADIPTGATHAIYVGGAGVVAVVFLDDSVALFTCVAGQILPVRAKRINATGTTASLMQALYQL